MKKTLAIVLALVMVLAMVPAAFAANNTTNTITNKTYDVTIKGLPKANTTAQASIALADYTEAIANKNATNNVSFEYDFDKLKKHEIDKWDTGKYMATVEVAGFSNFVAAAPAATPKVEKLSVTVNGKTLSLDDTNLAGDLAKYDLATDKLTFPIELPSTGLNMRYEIVVSQKSTDAAGDSTTQTETAVINLSGANASVNKAERSASFTVSSSKGNAYIVGNNVYLDYEGAAVTDEELTFTFKNDAGALFSEVGYLKAFSFKNNVEPTAVEAFADTAEQKLKDSTAKIKMGTAGQTLVLTADKQIKDVQLKIETRGVIYETPKFNIIPRYGVAKVDPKGIYFAESTKTIKIGESYTPVVMGVVTNLPVKADVVMLGTSGAELSLINIIDKKTVYGLAAGTTYISAEYTVKTGTEYKASSMKITVLNEIFAGAPTSTGTEKYVTCRTLNVRAGAGTSYKIVGKLSRNTKVAVIETANGWSKISFNGGTAYVSDKYLAK